MGRRSRKQRAEGARPAAAAPPGPARSPLRAAGDERPKAPWHPFPLVELCVLIGIVLIVLGFVWRNDDRGPILLVCGMALASLAGVDTAVREHFAGFRSHSTLLAGVPAIMAAGAVYFARGPIIVLLIAAVAVFAGAFAAFRRAFQRRSGGISFR
ncbi:MAG: hypothetical protein M3P50_10255 [Actinomycetota bacterium]|nr:hypothetical protein [Actinomycetota bacterium]